MRSDAGEQTEISFRTKVAKLLWLPVMACVGSGALLFAWGSISTKHNHLKKLDPDVLLNQHWWISADSVLVVLICLAVALAAFISAWNTFQEIRGESIAALRAFIEDLNTAPSHLRDSWAHALCERVLDRKAEIVVRMPLFREVLFPALLSGFQANRPGCARWLAGFESLLYNSPACWEQLPESARSAYGLLMRAIEADPCDQISRQHLLSILRSRFDYVLHELPEGVLYDSNSATPEQCEEMMAELDFYRLLAIDCATEEDRELWSEAAFHLSAYREYLLTRTEGDTYESFLRSRQNDAH